MYLIQIFRDKA